VEINSSYIIAEENVQSSSIQCDNNIIRHSVSPGFKSIRHRDGNTSDKIFSYTDNPVYDNMSPECLIASSRI